MLLFVGSDGIRLLQQVAQLIDAVEQAMPRECFQPERNASAVRQGDELLARIGETHKKTAAQVCLRWLTQQGIGVVPRTSKVERLEENLAIFDFDLSEAEMREIAGLARPGGRIVDWTYSPRWD